MKPISTRSLLNHTLAGLLGSGENAFNGTLIYARFLEDGSTFAPAFVQNNSFSGDDNRPDINVTTLDFYYVPKFADPRTLMTFDPALKKPRAAATGIS